MEGPRTAPSAERRTNLVTTEARSSGAASARALAWSATFPLLLFAALACLTVVLWRREMSFRAEDLAQDTRLVREQIARRLERMVEARTRALHGLAERTSRQPTEDFRASAEATRRSFIGCRSIAWVDASGKILRMVEGMDAPAETPVKTSFDQLIPNWPRAWETINARATPLISRVYNDSHGTAMIALIVPVTATSNNVREFSGAMVCQTALEPMLERAIDPSVRRDFDVKLEDAQRTVFQSPSAWSWSRSVNDSEPLHLPDATWLLHTRPAITRLAATGGRVSTWALGGGLAVSFLVALVVFQAKYYRQRDVALAQAYSRATERLHAVSAAISAQLGSGRDVLPQLAHAARELLKMSKVSIALLEKPALADSSAAPSLTAPSSGPCRLDQASLRVITSIGWMPSSVGKSMSLKAMPRAHQAIAEQRIIVVDDAQGTGAEIENDGVHGVRSAMLIPLLVEGRAIALMLLADEAPRKFTADERRLAQLWGAQAAVTLASGQLHQRAVDALRAQEQLLAQREKLAAVTAAVYAQPELDGTLRKITELIPSVLGVDVCAVTLLTETDGVLLVAAATPPYDQIVGQRLHTRYRPVERMFAERKPRIVPDLAAETELDPVWRQVPDAGSFVSLPLFFGDRRPLGLLTLVRRATGDFSREQVDLAQLFAARAATAIENARLHEQSNRDAQTKALLLRELNHRVKNNLARIAALLAVEENNVPEENRSRLSRLSQRIRLMAGTHELFAGGVRVIGMGDLVGQVLESLAVVRSPGIDVRIDLGKTDVLFGTDHAVALATVLHELAVNAIVHGMGERGVLQILARRDDSEGWLRLEVLDDGRGLDTALMANQRVSGASAAPSSDESDVELSSDDTDTDRADDGAAVGTAVMASCTGMGLQLVAGLVSRELHGHFTLHSRSGGGTRALVRFPLCAEAR